MDFAQRSRDGGGLGLAPHQASGLVGNLMQESGGGLRPWGPAGDNGTAWGTAQWRGDRLSGLQKYAADNGLDHRSVEAQQGWMRHEFDTSENPAYNALIAAKTPEEAATAVNRRYERSADNSGQREANARQLMLQFGGEQPALSSALAYNNTGAKVADTQEAAPALSDAAQNGSGILYPGSASTMQNQGYDWRSHLGKFAAALSSASNPEQAKVLFAQSQAPSKDLGTWSSFGSVDPKTGMQAMIHNKSGAVRTVKTQEPVEDPDVQAGKNAAATSEAKANVERFNGIQEDASKLNANIDQIHMMRKAVQDPNVNFGGAGDMLASAKNFGYSLGVPVNGLDSTQAVQRISTKMQLAQGKSLPGSISNYEDMLMARAGGVGLDKSRQANLDALDVQEAIYKHQQAYANEAIKYKQEHGQLDSGWFNRSQEWLAKNQLKVPTVTYSTPSSSPASNPKLPQGVRSIQLIPQ